MDPKKILQNVFQAAYINGASEIHLLLPMMEGVQGSSAFRVRGILVDIDPALEAMLGQNGDEILKTIYMTAMSRDSEMTRSRVMIGRISGNDMELPKEMDALDVTMIPAPTGGTHIILRPRPMSPALGKIHISWEKTAEMLLQIAIRPSRGLTVFVSPDVDVATSMMQYSARKIALQHERRFMVFDNMPWTGITNLGVSDIPASEFATAAIAASSAGVDIVVLDEIQNIPDGHEAVAKLLISGVHVWLRLRASTILSAEEIKDVMMLPFLPSVLIKSARVAMNDETSEPLSDKFSIQWLMENKISLIKGSLQRTIHSDFPSSMLMSELSAAHPLLPEDNDAHINNLSFMAAQLVDQGVLCAVDASKKLS